MLKHRVIPALLLQDGSLVKTKTFKDPRYVGDPINAIRIFNEKEVDELMVLDIGASRESREPNYRLIEEFASECFMPLTYGGGIVSVEHARRVFGVGVEKVCIQSAAFDDPGLIAELVSQFGSQSVVLSVDVKRSLFGRAKLFESRKRRFVREYAWIEWLKSRVELGVGEVLLGAVDRDGTLSGPDLELIELAAGQLSVPIVAVGGIGSLADMKAAVEAGASAVAAGALFVFHGPHRAVLITYPPYCDLESLFSKS